MLNYIARQSSLKTNEPKLGPPTHTLPSSRQLLEHTNLPYCETTLCTLQPQPSTQLVLPLCLFQQLTGQKKTLAHRPEDTVHHGWGEVTSMAVRPYSMACSHLRRPEAKRVEATLGYTLKFFCCLELTSANLLKQHHQLWFKCMRFGRHL